MVRPWCGAGRCSGCARCRLGLELTNRCRPESHDTKGYEQTLNTCAKKEGCQTNAAGWTVDGEKSSVTRKECNRLRVEFGVGCFMAQQELCNIAKNRMMEDKGALPKEEVNSTRDYKATHEKKFLQ